MPRQTLDISPVGVVNRRDAVDEMDATNVSSRENFLVEGIGDAKKNKKMPGSDRLTDGDISNVYTWIARYYSGSTAKSFAFNDGSLYHISPAGAETAKITGLSKTAYPVSEITKFSGNNVMFFADGFNGMYSHDGNADNSWKKESVVTLNFVGMVSHLDRMFGFEEDSENLYVSSNLDPTDYTDADDTAVITIGAKRGAKIQGIALLFETLFIFKEDSIWVLEGRSIQTFTVREVHTSLGVAARRSIAKTNVILFLGSDYQFYSFGGSLASTSRLSHQMAINGDMTKDVIPIINKNRMAQVCAIFHRDLYRCSFVETGQVLAKLEYIFNTTNQTDSLTRGNNVSAYMVQDKTPDKDELITGRSDAGLLMLQYQGLNWDNDGSGTMPVKLETAFVGKNIRNKRFLRVWGDFQVLGAKDLLLGYQLDTRHAGSDRKTEEMDTSGEYKSLTSFVRINSQTAITSRGILKRASAKGQSIGFSVDENESDRDISFSKITMELIVKEKKRSKKVGV